MKRRKVAVAGQTVLLRRSLLQHPPVDRAVWHVASDAAFAPPGLVFEHKGAAIPRVTLLARTLGQLQVPHAALAAVHIVARTTLHAPFGHWVMIGQFEFRRNIRVAASTAGLGSDGGLLRLLAMQRTVAIDAADPLAKMAAVPHVLQGLLAAMTLQARIGLLLRRLPTQPQPRLCPAAGARVVERPGMARSTALIERHIERANLGVTRTRHRAQRRRMAARTDAIGGLRQTQARKRLSRLAGMHAVTRRTGDARAQIRLVLAAPMKLLRVDFFVTGTTRGHAIERAVGPGDQASQPAIVCMQRTVAMADLAAIGRGGGRHAVM